ncbi:hypothetical protein ARZXY2_4463 (plasmid) [Arthrobacter sp. ZXY-2]|nr:hypothetical protein ARZXY2_4463 [Arthrobacter sp. ZXY-2]
MLLENFDGPGFEQSIYLGSYYLISGAHSAVANVRLWRHVKTPLLQF